MSNDVYVVLNGQEYVLEAGAMRPVESGYQRQVLEKLEDIGTRLSSLDTRAGRVEERMSNLEARVGVLESRQELILTKVDTLQTAVYWVLAAIGIFLAALAVIPGILQRKQEQAVQPQNSNTVDIDAFTRLYDFITSKRK